MRFIDVPTRDGTVLRGLHYAPADTGAGPGSGPGAGPGAGPAPVVLVLTPYGADRYHPDGLFFAGRGYHFVTLDLRGRGDSDGVFRPFHHDAADGHDAVAWLAGQAWSSGEVVTYGGSYSGFVQWALAGTRPPALRALAPVASVCPGVDFPMEAGLPLAYAVQWLAFNRGRRMNTGPWSDSAYWDGVHRDLGDRPFRDLDVASVGERLPDFQEWLDHPAYDDYWASFVPSEPVTVPVLAITGQYDDDQLGALTYHGRHGATHLVVGPWDHAATRTAATSFGGLDFPADSAVDLRALHADWYDAVLGRGPAPGFLADRVAYYHVGEGWRYASALPQGSPRRLPLPDTVLDLDPALVGDEPDGFREDLPDSAFVATAPAHPVSGRPRAHLALSSQLQDFDLLVSLYLLDEGEDATLLGEAVLRSHGADLTRPVELTFPFLSRTPPPTARFAVRIRAPHRRYRTNHAATGQIRLSAGSYLELPA
ncbi:CocE/NonD family hydrolase [Actinacidiphila bryophytorum]|uniref:CocE/NonD family hydrolase n=2 Tax=Actinacidiphila bryophytorum TaxID=1436133 RepID=A0A9W4GX66_9ACTN|nr:CocE/NonD family hydrolase [Actinacidiphila bryophytorum]MBM9438881.1 CocE/NonD family hydrolase [Actinacidiphila bryophytorum]CAG7615667.1 Putative CocE/NonD family hydrolase [Actinacidiphila bryophytorum]